MACLLAVALAGLGTHSPTQSAAVPALTRGPYLQQVTQTGATFHWETRQATGSRVDYGVGAYTQTVADPQPVRRHRVRLSRLLSGTRYRYRVVSGGAVLSGDESFATAKPPGRPFRFAVFGDSGSGERAQYVLAERIAAAAPDFVLHTGDVVYPRGAQAGYDARFFRPYASLLDRVPIWPTLGNHDVMTRNGAPYLENFDLPRNGPAGLTPERVYSFDYADAHFACLDSTLSDGALRNTVVPWLRRDLGASPRRWKFVFFHHPPYSSGLHGESTRVQRLVVPALSAARVDIVFSGHDHAYERSRPIGGVTYVVTGAGGAGLYQHKHPHAYTARFYNRRYSFTRVDVDGASLRLRQIASDGSVVDDYGVRNR